MISTMSATQHKTSESSSNILTILRDRLDIVASMISSLVLLQARVSSSEKPAASVNWGILNNP